MNLRNVKLVWLRELTDQLRDRRTLFMVGVLPLLIYPLLAASFLQLSYFFKEHSATVLVIGGEQLEQLDGVPDLFDGERFNRELFDRPAEAAKIAIERGEKPASVSVPDYLRRESERLSGGELDAIIYFPQDFADRLAQLRVELKSYGQTEGPITPLPEPPRPVVRTNAGREASQVAQMRLDRVLGRWRKQVIAENMDASRIPPAMLKPFSVIHEDVATASQKQAGIWGKLLPFVVFVWALTGAFYPAVDLCAGEKERGTIETLLVSPALRTEIVWGKLLTVICFSIATALLNLFGIGMMGMLMSEQFAAAGGMGAAGLGTPPLNAMAWLVVALLPIAALFSALSFACASFARSTKEGQYYFMPLFLVLLPLLMIPLSPGVELSLGNAMVPVMGLVLLLRTLIAGEYAEALRFALPVVLVTAGCCLLAIKWAVRQFNDESVLFRGSERFDLRLWLARTLRQKPATPTVGMALACFAAVLTAQVTGRFFMPAVEPTFAFMAKSVVLSQACVIVPVILFTLLLVRSTRETLGLRAPRISSLFIAALMALAAHPLGIQLFQWIQSLYPTSEAMLEQLAGASKLLQSAPSPWLLILLFAILPALVEEFTFRGFILTGLRSSGSTWWPVVITALAFGFTHTIFQQSLSAAALGVLIGAIAVFSRSIWPCIIFHAVYNSMPLMLGYYAKQIEAARQSNPVLAKLIQGEQAGEVGYHPAVVTTGALLTAGLVWLLAWSNRDTPDRPKLTRTHAASDRQGLPPGLLPPETTEG